MGEDEWMRQHMDLARVRDVRARRGGVTELHSEVILCAGMGLLFVVVGLCICVCVGERTCIVCVQHAYMFLHASVCALKVELYPCQWCGADMTRSSGV